ncbi:MAG: N-acetyl-gamma-glutamyl-phosphate reductase [Clostridiales bacterium]|nr:N-acetyl-gamma-glutamyl-phosphate reductase [Clostridiales bacterium]
MSKINAGIIGATGYVGGELFRLLSAHPGVNICGITSQSSAGKRYGEIYENFRHSEIVCEPEDWEKLAEECDVIFAALPHGLVNKKLTPALLEKTRVIDLGADFRLKDPDIYKAWYCEHGSPELIKSAAYGLCEINREEIRKSRLVANPGCYAACSILCMYPLVKHGLIDKDSVIIDAKSGVSGAGRGVSLGSHYNEVNESIKAYKIAGHRHTPEIEEQLFGIKITFTPHLTPMNRGILATCYARTSATEEALRGAFRREYGGERFIRLCAEGVFPETKWVKASNFVDIGLALDGRTGRVIVIGALDNLMKGAAGTAVQNMNLLFGLPEETGLEAMPAFPV